MAAGFSLTTKLVAVIGCGACAQIMRLPSLRELAQLEIDAICDTSPAVVEPVGNNSTFCGPTASHSSVQVRRLWRYSLAATGITGLLRYLATAMVARSDPGGQEAGHC